MHRISLSNMDGALAHIPEALEAEAENKVRPDVVRAEASQMQMKRLACLRYTGMRSTRASSAECLCLCGRERERPLLGRSVSEVASTAVDRRLFTVRYPRCIGCRPAASPSENSARRTVLLPTILNGEEQSTTVLACVTAHRGRAEAAIREQARASLIGVRCPPCSDP